MKILRISFDIKINEKEAKSILKHGLVHDLIDNIQLQTVKTGKMITKKAINYKATLREI